MSIWEVIPELPLLRRELTELSSRRRTYIIRFIGAIVVLTVVLMYYGILVSQLSAYNPAATNSNPNRMLGAGGPIFKGIVPILFVSVQMLMPALICGSITIEKERNTIGTLFVTRLSPMTIVLEKLGSRLVPMFTFLLLTFPVLAFVYSLGGVETTLLLGTMWLLFCECLLYASIGLLCSSWFATTVTAFIWSYVLTGLLAVFSKLLAHDLPMALPTPYYLWLSMFDISDAFLNSPLRLPRGDGFWPTVGRLIIVGMTTVPSLMVTGVLVLLARVFLFRRAFISPASVMLKVFKAIDGFFARLNDRTTGGMVLMKDYNSMPTFDPVAWRERSKKSLGKARYLFRILVAMEGPTMFICVGAATLDNDRSDFAGLRTLLLLIWAITGMILAMKGSTLISAERVRETLDALLSTPLTLREILSQKIAGMSRLMMVLAIPILSVHFTLLLLNVDFYALASNRSFLNLFLVCWYAVSCVLTTFLTMKILAWLAVLLGLRSQSQSRSAMTAICLLAFWVLLSSYICRPREFVYEMVRQAIDWDSDPDEFYYSREQLTPKQMQASSIAAAVCCMMRPDGGVQANEAVLLSAGSPYVDRYELYYAPSRSVSWALMVSIIVLVWQVVLLSFVRAVTLWLAPRLLGRVDQEPDYRSLDAQLIPSYPVVGSEVIA